MQPVASWMSLGCVRDVTASSAVFGRKVRRKKRVVARKVASPNGPVDMRLISAWRMVTSARHVCGSRRR